MVSERLNTMTAQRPPDFSRSKTPSSTRWNCSASWLIHMRMAWKVSFAGCWPRSSTPCFTSRHTSASSSDDRYGPSRRWRRRMASASLWDRMTSLSSPYSWITHASSAALTVRSHSWAGVPKPGFRRKSRGPSSTTDQPLPLSSACACTPRLMTTPMRFCTLSSTRLASSLRGTWWNLRRGSSRSSTRATAAALGSMSKATSRPFAESCFRISQAYRPRPNVQST
mmetsp:Transcript_126204/g.356921  ORF Transcript_126204/g.356921 Transcript_126204/m.356921 type:complete len:225 (+) Transcript_126204:395-1069(+)